MVIGASNTHITPAESIQLIDSYKEKCDEAGM
jgi:hypothetical protein